MTSPRSFAPALALLSALFVTAPKGSAAAAPDSPLCLVPRPASVQTLPDQKPFLLTAAHARIIVAVEPSVRSEVQGVADRFAEWLRPATGLSVPVRIGKADRDAIVLTTTGAPASLGDEGYTLSVRADGVTIRAPHPAGLFYGLQTLRQMLPPGAERKGGVPAGTTLPAVTITDQPRFPVRSLMIDSARHRQSIAFLKHTLDLLAYHKMNRLHWHLTDDQGWRLEIKKYPRLTSVGAWRMEAGQKRYGGFYTQAQVKDLVAYARQRYITIEPEIDMPAHSQAALAAYPELACFPGPFIVSTVNVSSNGHWTPDVICAGKDSSFKFIEDVLTEVMALFPCHEIHIGGDECPKDRWHVCPVCQARIKALGLKDETALQNDFTNRIAAFLAAHGRRLQGWNEILEGGTLPRDVVAQTWNRAGSAAQSVQAGHDNLYSFHTFLYLDYSDASVSVNRVYSAEPVPAGITPEEARHILGLETCLWTEHKVDDVAADQAIWPRVCAESEVGWTPQSLRDWNDFRSRMLTVHNARVARIDAGADASDAQVQAVIAGYLERGDFNPGVAAGEWTPDMISETPVTREWDITSLLHGPGTWTARLRYTSGAHAIFASEVDLLADGVIVAKDVHEGHTGAITWNPLYRLELPSYDPAAHYALRVHLRGDGGTDSHGTIYLAPPLPPTDAKLEAM